MSPLRSSLAALVAAAAVFAAGCGSDNAQRRSLALTDCRLPNLATAAQCGELEVPEDRDRPDGRKLRIFAAVLPANTLTPRDDPLLVLAGGPGQAASFLAPFATRLAELRRTRDIVLVDQRGTGRSSPLACQAFKPRDDDVFETDPVPRARQCAQELAAQGIDAAQYTTTAWIADLEAVRKALGYPRWNVWGGSYGTRVAQEYLRRHPDAIRTVTLDGVAPPAMVITLDVWRTREAALEAVFDACAASPSCRRAHPDVAGTLARVEHALGTTGRDLAIVDPRTGAVERHRVTFDVVLAALQPLTYTPETVSLLPEMLSLAAGGELAPLFAANPALSGNLAEQMNAALHFSVTCAEDVPRIRPGSERDVLAGLPSRRLAEQTIAVCDVWPRGRMPADFADPVRSDKPVLLLSGGMDPVTPPAYGTAVAKGFPNGRHVIAPGYGHIVSPHACAPRLLGAFVDAGSVAALPEACIARLERSVRPPLWPDRLGPQP
ncbi:MAG: alpha/beta hydrolase [Burkholderiales bacterium]